MSKETPLEYKVADFSKRLASRQAQLLNLPTFDLEVDKENFLLRRNADGGGQDRYKFECWVTSLGYSLRVEGIWWDGCNRPFEFTTQFMDHML